MGFEVFDIIAKLFVDRSLPSASVSGTVAVAGYLERRGMARSTVAAGVIVNLTSYFSVYTALLLPALWIPFEASSVLTLERIGVLLPLSLAATLLFRGLSFWLPMIPGAWYARRLFAVRHRIR